MGSIGVIALVLAVLVQPVAAQRASSRGVHGTVFVQSTTPTTAQQVRRGDLWYDTSSGEIRVCSIGGVPPAAPYCSQWDGVGGAGNTPSSSVAALDGTATAGVATTFARGDHKHADANRPTDAEKAALAGTSGAPGNSNRYVTHADARLSDARTPSAHAHPIADVTSLQPSLDGKAASVHGHAIADVANLQTGLDSKAAAAHGHAISDVTNLQPALDGKAATSHAHVVSDVTGLQTTLDGKAASSHVHVVADTTGLQAALDAKAAASHTHTATDLASGNLAVARFNEGTGASGSTFWRGDGTWAAPPGGSDPWTYMLVNSGADFSTTSNAAQAITGLTFTPGANTRTELECRLALRTATATVNPRVGLAWATGLTDGVAVIAVSQAATGTPLFASGNLTAVLLTAVGGLPNTTQSWPAEIRATIIAGASPGGSMAVQLASETNGTSVTAKGVGSFCRRRTF